MTFIGSELLCNCHHRYVFTVSHEDSGLARSHEDEAVLGVIDIKIGSDIEDKVN